MHSIDNKQYIKSVPTIKIHVVLLNTIETRVVSCRNAFRTEILCNKRDTFSVTCEK
jgi:hypothetical protein